MSVGSSGSASYQLPILTPPGISQPSLSIQYSSQGGNGPLGMGWSLGGLSQLSRCPRSKVVDGVNDGALQFNANDRLCLDGQRLILKSGTYGGNNAEYRTQIDSDLKIVGKGAFNSSSAWFEVRTKSGDIMEYGRTSNSRRAISPNGTTSSVPITWALNKVSDRFTNYHTISYLLDSGVLYPQTISYSGNATAGTSPTRTVTLDWGISTPRLDPIGIYVGGGVHAQIRYRLKGISNNVTPARYRIHYSDSDAQLSHLTKLEYCPDGSTTNCMKVDGKYGLAKDQATGKRTAEPELALAYFGSTQGWTSQSAYPRELADVNGDGMPDIVGFSKYGTYVSLGSSGGFEASKLYYSGFSTGSGWGSAATHPRMVVDINGDGYSDIVGFGDSHVYVSLSDGEKANTVTSWISGLGGASGWANQDSHPRMLADVNGDGLQDIVGFGGATVKVALNRQTSFEFSSDFPEYTSEFYKNAGWSSNDKFPRTLADVNGDGKDDIVGFGPTGVKVALSTGSGFAPATLWLADFFPKTETYTESQTYTYGTYSFVMDTTFTRKSWQAQSQSPRYLYDFDGDGLPDIVAIEWDAVLGGTDLGLPSFKYRPDLTIYVAKNTGTGFAAPQIVQSGGELIVQGQNDPVMITIDSALTKEKEKRVATYSLADINGDGRGDIVHFDGACTSFRPSLGLTLGESECFANGFTQANGNWTDKDDRLFADINGDGALDLFGYSPAGVVISYGLSDFPDQIHTFTSDIGVAHVDYGTLVDSKVYTKDTGAVFPVMDVQSPMTVVSALRMDDGLGGFKTTRYRYGGMRSHFDYGSLGFRWSESEIVMVRGPDLLMEDDVYEVAYNEYLQTFPLTGSLYRTQDKHCYPGIPFSGGFERQ
ncbi:FG-GAP-like repeat-containing protein, partial [Halopseudomonas sabulinigri]|uniref:FG-GAP-like repeat-containing protein n=1 Tax=Halopseudomonas sabulinigri TaxID=472181 RepID=UPI003342CF13